MKWSLHSPNLKRCSDFFRCRGRTMLLAGGGLLGAFLLISCVATNRALVVPPHIEGAKFVGSDACAECHDTITKPFRFAAHAHRRAKGTNPFEVGCESCHGGGSIHVEAGGGRGNIINPSRSPQICFDCHLDKRGEFSLPYHHPV